ncbi:TonB-dependent receptor SusC, partial [termite gut metagenome]
MRIKKTFRRSCRLSKKTVLYLLVIIDFLGIENALHASTADILADKISQEPDSVITTMELDAIRKKFSLLKPTERKEVIVGIFDKKDNLDVSVVSRSPFISIQQLLKGNIPGVYVQENNGEPGTIQNMFLRGTSTPIFSNRDVLGAQPVVYINGIPIIQDHSFVYDIKQYDVNPIGTASNILAGFDMNEIQSIEVIKDPLKLAKLGPLASNGAIWITTKSSYTGGKNVTVNTSLSIVAPPSKIRTTNAGYERNFRENFYNSYFHDIPAVERYYPDYLRDHTDTNYFGNSDWADDYYAYASQYNVNASIGGGSANANYLFTMGGATNAGVADATSFGKYNVSFYLNMSPLEGLMVHSMLSGGKTDRNRNRNFRDRYAEVEYLPTLSTPIAPSKEGYQHYLSEYEETVDDNINNVLNGYLGLNFKEDNYYADTKLLVNYNTNTRHVFWPSTLMESVSFVSDYSGYNRRLLGSGTVGYYLDINPNHLFDIQ